MINNIIANVIANLVAIATQVINLQTVVANIKKIQETQTSQANQCIAWDMGNDNLEIIWNV